ncbi:hypothetical protein L2E82_18341 [Cichorium intybus]|uniref:Uncharacterized protein n=1 Tax=Cichorium intybus TaxID=13427 RepID=A0ACB9F9U1_CICIN|nr:hypothetical protein L2E82_18341 [Cichorium intybus]
MAGDEEAPKKAKSTHIVRKHSERIMKKHAFSRFKNNASDPVMIDMDDDFVNYKQPEIITTKVTPKTTHEQRSKKGHEPVINLVSPVVVGSDESNKDIHSNIVHKMRTKNRSDTIINLDSPVVIGSAIEGKGN